MKNLRSALTLAIAIFFTACSVNTEATSTLQDESDGQGNQTIYSLTLLLQYANALHDSAVENFHMRWIELESPYDSTPLSSGQAIKRALAECAFEDNAFATPERSYQAAHTVWQEIRDEVNAGQVKVYRVNGRIVDGNTYHVPFDSCNVAGAPCEVAFETTRNGDKRLLTVAGDSCQ